MAYVDQIIGDHQHGVSFRYFGGPLLRHDVDVVHVSQIDTVITARAKTARERREAATALVKTLTTHDVALVQTVPVRRSGERQEWRDILDDATRAFIVFDEVTPTPDPARTTVIPHAHYRERFLGYPQASPIPGRLVSFARSKLGRAAEAPLKIFSVVDTPDLSLRVAGEADAPLEALIRRAIGRDRDRVSARIEVLSDGAMVAEVTAAELVLLGSMETLEDLSALFLALSLDRPVLLPASSSVSALAAQVGPGWIWSYAGPLTAATLDATIESLRSTPRAERPDLDGRGWDVTADRYTDVFRAVADPARNR